MSLLSLLAFSAITHAQSDSCLSASSDNQSVSAVVACQLECLREYSYNSAYDLPCSDEWVKKCKSLTPTFLGRLIRYPGLTPAEIKLVQAHPSEAWTVFQLKNMAESSSERNFPDQGLSDESDAMRHFVWAALITNELGQERAKLYLLAHESDLRQPARDREMDLTNDKSGQAAALKLISENNFNLYNLEALALKELKNKRLVVVKPGLKIPERPL